MNVIKYNNIIQNITQKTMLMYLFIFLLSTLTKVFDKNFDIVIAPRKQAFLIHKSELVPVDSPSPLVKIINKRPDKKTQTKN